MSRGKIIPASQGENRINDLAITDEQKQVV